MPNYGPEVIGPPPRDTNQQFWDPELQTMDPARRRALQDERLRTMIRTIFERPAAGPVAILGR